MVVVLEKGKANCCDYFLLDHQLPECMPWVSVCNPMSTDKGAGHGSPHGWSSWCCL